MENNEKKERIKHTFGIHDDKVLSEKMELIKNAAENEYTDFFSNSISTATIRDFRINRLYYLIKYFYKGIYPSEREVAKIFGITTSNAQGIIRSVFDKYSFDLDNIFLENIKSLLLPEVEMEGIEDYYLIDSKSKELIRKINDFIFDIDRNLEPIKKLNDISNMYKIEKNTQQALLTKVSIDG